MYSLGYLTDHRETRTETKWAHIKRVGDTGGLCQIFQPKTDLTGIQWGESEDTIHKWSLMCVLMGGEFLDSFCLLSAEK
jgi:hypothetical protein